MGAVESDAAPDDQSGAVPRSSPAADAIAGIWCPELDLSDGVLRSVSEPEPGHRAVRALVRSAGTTLGYVTVPEPPAQVSVGRLAALARLQFAARLGALEAARTAATTPTAPVPALSVVVCTRDRAQVLAGCLEALRGLDAAAREILVVDNAPADGATRAVVAAAAALDPRIRYVHEPRPGLSCARNRGLREARSAWVAFTDDDAVVDAGWAARLAAAAVEVQPGARPTGLVTGLVCSATLTTAAELYFDARNASWSSGLSARTFDLAAYALPDALYPYSPGVFGTGANLAIDRILALTLGGFDEALGAGTLTRGGEDLDMFVRVVRAGRAIRYEPSAVVWHRHRSQDRALVGQMYGYGSGLSAYLTKLLSSRRTRADVLRRIPRGALRLLTIARHTEDRLASVRPPRGALLAEFAGYLAGPALYLRSRRRSGPPAADARVLAAAVGGRAACGTAAGDAEVGERDDRAAG